jgi:hypothetical protein
MAAEDQRIREPPEGPDQFVRFLSTEEAMEHARIDVSNTDRLREIVRRHGWPGLSHVGEAGAEAAWLIAQHADRQLDFQREVLPLLTAAAANGEAKARHAAYLTDRICMAEGRPQVTGPRSATCATADPSRGRSTTSKPSTRAARPRAWNRSRTTCEPSRLHVRRNSQLILGARDVCRVEAMDPSSPNHRVLAAVAALAAGLAATEGRVRRSQTRVTNPFPVGRISTSRAQPV